MIRDYFSYLDELNIDSESLDKLEIFANFVLEENEKYNLTAITNEEEFVIKHFYDCLVLKKFFNLDGLKVMDVGSGAGFPGIPLAIVNKNTTFYLVESNKKKCDFLEKVKEKLNLDNVIVLNKRVEELDDKYRNYFDVATSRAVAALNILLELSAPFVKNNGKLILYKGVNYQKEIEEAANAIKLLKLKKPTIYSYKIALSLQDRVILVLEKGGNIDKIYPRRFSIISKKPL